MSLYRCRTFVVAINRSFNQRRNNFCFSLVVSFFFLCLFVEKKKEKIINDSLSFLVDDQTMRLDENKNTISTRISSRSISLINISIKSFSHFLSFNFLCCFILFEILSTTFLQNNMKKRETTIRFEREQQQANENIDSHTETHESETNFFFFKNKQKNRNENVENKFNRTNPRKKILL